jgi:hypothetical protein
MPYLHLPVQSGSDRILKAMNRGHTAEHYLRLVEKVRAARPDIALSGDLIVGFPGETEADFEATLALVRKARYAACFTFKYSRRPGTPASAMARQVDEDIKTERLRRLQALIDEQQRAFNAATVGRTLPVLFEKPGRRPGQVGDALIEAHPLRQHQPQPLGLSAGGHELALQLGEVGGGLAGGLEVLLEARIAAAGVEIVQAPLGQGRGRRRWSRGMDGHRRGYGATGPRGQRPNVRRPLKPNLHRRSCIRVERKPVDRG